MYLTVFLSGYEYKMNISMREKRGKQSSNIRLQTQ